MPAKDESDRASTASTFHNDDYARFFSLSLDMLCIAGFDGYFKHLNPIWQPTLGFTIEELMSQPFVSFVHPDDVASTLEAAGNLSSGRDVVTFINRYRCKDGTYRWIEWRSASIPERQQIYATARDITQQRAAEETIRRQAAALMELSTPLIPISDHVLVMPLVGTMDTLRAKQVLDTLLEGVGRSRAEVAILDITGVSVVDTQVASALIMAARAVRLLGGEVVLTGIRPDVAATLVGLGADLSGIATCGTLQAGIGYAIRAAGNRGGTQR
ncbi:MAG: PAS domain S-box protein [Polyangiaceae bacterium]|nr:PAS domain S-box protein [Polyangiaceae bacterium]NUQ72220.1 PAS domain S-box protein [Polyangiaceae bacterium]